MHENIKLQSTYQVQQLDTQVKWDDVALHQQAFNGLAKKHQEQHGSPP